MKEQLDILERVLESSGIQILNIGGIHSTRYVENAAPAPAFTDMNMNEIKPGAYATIDVRVIIPMAKD